MHWIHALEKIPDRRASNCWAFLKIELFIANQGE